MWIKLGTPTVCIVSNKINQFSIIILTFLDGYHLIQLFIMLCPKIFIFLFITNFLDRIRICRIRFSKEDRRQNQHSRKKGKSIKFSFPPPLNWLLAQIKYWCFLNWSKKITIISYICRENMKRFTIAWETNRRLSILCNRNHGNS